jgi:hypothetical protein
VTEPAPRRRGLRRASTWTRLSEPVQATQDVFEQSEALLLDPILLLRRTETAVVRADLAVPGVLSAAELSRLRYLASFARLGRFTPGAARANGASTVPVRPEIDLAPDVEALRRRTVAELADPVRRVRDPRARLERAGKALTALAPLLEETRDTVLAKYAAQFSAAELAAEVAHRELVLVMGGGAGAGHVYLGALGMLADEGLLPSYMLGASIGSLYGGIFGRDAVPDYEALSGFAKSLTMADVLAPPRRHRFHGMPGMFGLNLGNALHPMLCHPDGTPVRMNETGIPFEAVVAGVRPSAFATLPNRLKYAEISLISSRAGAATRRGAALAARMWQVGAFFDSRVVKPIVIGADPASASMRVVDAIGFSCAVPGVLHYESDEHAERGLLDALLEDKGVRALVDGGATSNVPAELAWRRVQDGRIGTRNAIVLAFDCFHPQWDPRHLWMTPITQSLQVQMVRNAPFADWVRRFSPTLGVLDLVPGAERFDRAAEWGRASLAADLPMLRALLEPTHWD